MFRVNQTEWINPRLKGGNTYSSEYFDTFVDAENFVKKLIDAIN